MPAAKPIKIGATGIPTQFDATDTVSPANGGTGLSTANFSGNAGKVLAVNGAETALELVAPGSGGGGVSEDLAIAFAIALG